jgi:uncharacterized protein (DUF2249 family)
VDEGKGEVMAVFINVADIQDPNDPDGRSYRKVNAEKQHKIPLGTLVELESGERLYVVAHNRDCDNTPLYSLGMKNDNNDPIERMKWQNGYCEDDLAVVNEQALAAEKQRADGLQERLKQIEECYADWHHLGKDTNADILWKAIESAQEGK